MKSSLAALQPWISGATITGAAEFSGVSTDSKTVASGNLFVALRGERFDAHTFLEEVANKGAAAVVVDHLPPGLKVPALVVRDTKVALGEIGNYWRRQFSIPVIGVTGSNGKTTVKEMIAAILAAEYGEGNYLSTRGNLNNDIGVPLTILRMDATHRAAVIELGMNHPGEIASLAAIAQPTVGLVNNAQREHQEFMESVEAVAKENGSVISALPANGIAVFPADDPFTSLWRRLAKSSGQRKILSFGLSADASVTCSYQPNAFGSDLIVRIGQKEFPVRLSAAGVHNVRNALAAIACTLAIGVHRTAIVRGLENFSPVAGRLQRKTAKNGALVIDDTYNANPDSVRAAIDVLMQVPAPRVLVLGDMGEVGTEGRQFHIEVGAYARGRGIDALYTLGELASHASDAFGSRAKHFSNVDDLNRTVENMLTPQASVLIKGSRFMKMERVVQHLVGAQAKESH
ncbi:UDP-N-acetylmuramoyl-tripeptide--D-alanyl-D-alanine ligase [Oxalobacteraceae bacterium R-40]|uniref:UDP-N-acetylmuramoyl-tripeptide--D-alanyl-D-alanine ligase n=1 Tax=Keguizhuia sedimenti TaxID=3064264 RepID=A0ABU1BQX0_9BURK|nr:UDP-N-acetylmuramoyl-tripeptide--D-alanyl-D-alanine ligase [Oxalobacteraceae bacterium R-40]